MTVKPQPREGSGREGDPSGTGRVIPFPVAGQTSAGGEGRTNGEDPSLASLGDRGVEPSAGTAARARRVPLASAVVLALVIGGGGGAALWVWRAPSVDPGAAGAVASSATASTTRGSAAGAGPDPAAASPQPNNPTGPRPRATDAPRSSGPPAGATAPAGPKHTDAAAAGRRPTSVQPRAATPGPTSRSTTALGGESPLPRASAPPPRPATTAPGGDPPQTPTPREPTARPDPVPATGHVALRSAAGGPLGRDVVAYGRVEHVDRYACVWAGWKVVTARDWRASYIKARVPVSGGSFTTETLQLGSDGETSSVWNAFIIAGDPAGCAAIATILAASSDGVYQKATWPPGVDQLYLGQDVRREQ